MSPTKAELQAIIDAPGLGRGRAYIDQKTQEAEALALLPIPERMAPVRASTTLNDWMICSFGLADGGEGEEWFLTTDSVRASSLVDAHFPCDAKIDAHAVAALLNAWRMGCIVPKALSNRDAEVETVAKVICAETCAFMGEPACFRHFDAAGDPLPWPPEGCCNPGCMALAEAVVAKLRRATA
jgi:hypothetical protein